MDIEEPNCFMLPCLRQRHGRQCSEASAAGEWARSIQIPRGTEKPHRSMSSNRSFSRRSQLASHVINWLDATLGTWLEPRGQSVGHLAHANNDNNNYEVGHLASSNSILLCFASLCFALHCFKLLCFASLCLALICFALLCFALL